MTLLAIDPGRSFKGEASIGVCLFDDDGKEIWRGSNTFEQLVHWLDLGHDSDPYGGFGWEYLGYAIHADGWQGPNYFRIAEVVIEDFVNNTQSKGGQRNGTSECIGAVEFACMKTGTPFTRQKPDRLGPAKMHAPTGSWKPLKHLRHEDSAYLHGYEYLVRKGVLGPAGLQDTLHTDRGL